MSGDTKEAVSAVARASSEPSTRGWIVEASCWSPAFSEVASLPSTCFTASSCASTEANASGGSSRAASSAAPRKSRGAHDMQSWRALSARRVLGSREAPAAVTAEPIAPDTQADAAVPCVASAIIAWAEASAAPASLDETVCFSGVESESSSIPPISSDACCTAEAATSPSQV
eukprot:scaffold330394_cov53-Tisochrysis_lutea.AAC.2